MVFQITKVDKKEPKIVDIPDFIRTFAAKH
jgi:hypothetical protein